MKPIIFLLFLCVIAVRVWSAPDNAAVAKIQEVIHRGDIHFALTQTAIHESEALSAQNLIQASFLWKGIAEIRLSQLQASREETVALAESAYRVSFPKDWPVRVDSGLSADWSAHPTQGATLGNGAFQSPGWLGMMMAAVNRYGAHRDAWPLTIQDKHLADALIYSDLLSKAGDFGLSDIEEERLKELMSQHQAALGLSDLEGLRQKEWPLIISMTPGKAVEQTHLYVPPFLYASDTFFTFSIFSGDDPIPHVPVMIGTAKASGYLLKEMVFTDEDGQARILGTQNSSLAIFPLLDPPVFSTRIPMIRRAPSIAPAPDNPPVIFPNPTVFEPATEEVFTGSDLMLEKGVSSVTLGSETLPILAGSPSFLVTKIPLVMPERRELTVTTSAGARNFLVNTVLLDYHLQSKTPHQGEEDAFILEEKDVPAVNVAISVDSPRLIFKNGELHQVITILQNQEKSVPMQGMASGQFHLVAGVAHPAYEKALLELLAVKPMLHDESDIQLLNDVIWSLEKGQISAMQNLLEQLRFQALIKEKLKIPTGKVLKAFSAQN